MALAKIKVIPAKFNPFIKDFRHYYHVYFNEEKLAYCIGSCTRQIVDNLYKLKIL
ncbi:hypothetical protein [Aulosira sp. FACHB-615]|uniref:hypothetical protein n=1 Tax=Aulosira sp. FACHB-615 TaxID=2692777 RepID=UPI0016838EA4|nr:hypothetical protein [Aulosira sp. FACHB-615]MBD2489032.1 hypothetical protein [Aulosira sp. FACHB-615]